MGTRRQQRPEGGLRQRVTALRNVPPALRIVWQSGPGVVTLGLVARVFAAVLPLGLLWITKLIIDNIVHAASTASRRVAPLLVAGGIRIRPRMRQQHSGETD